MKKKDLPDIERKLNITLPRVYRDLVVARGAELKETGCFDDDLSSFFINPKDVIRTNKLERKPDSGTACAFPHWWETFFLVGTNGAGDYFCLRLDNKPGVWMIGSDCGNKPKRLYPSLKKLVDERLGEHRQETERNAQRQDVIGDELAVEMEAVAGSDDPNAKNWLTASFPYPMFPYLDNLGYKISPRKLRLYGLACCRRLDRLPADEDCVQALALAERLVAGTADMKKVARLRERMKAKYLAMVKGREHSLAGLWEVGAARNLLQDDNDYLNDAPIYAGDAQLVNVWNSAHSAGFGEEYPSLADLLREVLGNPFHPAKFEDTWRTPAVTASARHIYDHDDFDRMPALTDVLVAAGCDDLRVLAHCRRKGGHVRGCWLLDLILKNEPDPQETAFTWDFKWDHPTIDGAELKKRLQAFGTDRGGSVDVPAALTFADWLEKKGDPAWANYIRFRCDLDDLASVPDYPAAFEQYLERGAMMKPGRAEFEGLYFSGYRFAEDAWWEEHCEDFVLGLPSLVHPVPAGKGASPPEHLIERLDALVRNTPVRGVDFDNHYREVMTQILESPGGRQLRALALCNDRYDKEPSAVFEALRRASVASNLERLSIQFGIFNDEDTIALARTPFKRLARFDSPYGGLKCSEEAATRLLTAPWFRKLRHVQITRPGMFPELTTLHLVDPYTKGGGSDTAAFLRKLATPKLRQLVLDDCNLDDACASALATSPTFANLTRLTIRQGYTVTSPVSARAAASLFRSANLQHLLELNCHNVLLGSAIECLADRAVLPRLANCSFWGSNAPETTIDRLKKSRPFVSIGS